MKSMKCLLDNYSKNMLKVESIRKEITSKLIELDEILTDMEKIHVDLKQISSIMPSHEKISCPKCKNNKVKLKKIDDTIEYRCSECDFLILEYYI